MSSIWNTINETFHILSFIQRLRNPVRILYFAAQGQFANFRGSTTRCGWACHIGVTCWKKWPAEGVVTTAGSTFKPHPTGKKCIQLPEPEKEGGSRPQTSPLLHFASHVLCLILLGRWKPLTARTSKPDYWDPNPTPLCPGPSTQLAPAVSSSSSHLQPSPRALLAARAMLLGHQSAHAPPLTNAHRKPQKYYYYYSHGCMPRLYPTLDK